MSWKRPLWPATPSHSLHLHTFEYRYDSFFFFFFCIHAYERRSGNACFLPVLPTGFRLFDIKKVSETPPRGITRGFFFTNFPIPLIFNANSNCFRRDFTWLCLVLSDWFRFIDYRWVYPLPPSLVGDGIHTAVKSMKSQSKRVSKVRTKRRKFRKRRTQWFVQDRVKYVLSSFLLDVFSFY